eukprot:SAG31_NODE_3467_length_4242_cov_1.967415_3_plen_192_part_00
MRLLTVSMFISSIRVGSHMEIVDTQATSPTLRWQQALRHRLSPRLAGTDKCSRLVLPLIYLVSFNCVPYFAADGTLIGNKWKCCGEAWPSSGPCFNRRLSLLIHQTRSMCRYILSSVSISADVSSNANIPRFCAHLTSSKCESSTKIKQQLLMLAESHLFGIVSSGRTVGARANGHYCTTLRDPSQAHLGY